MIRSWFSTGEGVPAGDQFGDVERDLGGKVEVSDGDGVGDGDDETSLLQDLAHLFFLLVGLQDVAGPSLTFWHPTKIAVLP